MSPMHMGSFPIIQECIQSVPSSSIVPIQDLLVKFLTNPPLAYGLQPWLSNGTGFLHSFSISLLPGDGKATGFCPPPRIKSASLTKGLVVFMTRLDWKTSSHQYRFGRRGTVIEQSLAKRARGSSILTRNSSSFSRKKNTSQFVFCL